MAVRTPALATVQKISDTIWELPTTFKQGMRVPARIYEHGDRLLSAGRRLPRKSDILLDGSWKRPDDESHQSPQALARSSPAARPRDARGLCAHSILARAGRRSRARLQDIDEVIEAAERAGISRRVARLTPVGNVKG
jgi:hypothetical protein